MIKRKVKLKKPAKVAIQIVSFILIVFIGIFAFYRYNIHQLKQIGYSEKASKNILLQFRKKDVLLIGENKTLNKAFESSYYIDDNFDSYSKIKYQDQKNLIKNINTLIKKKYSNSNISMIIARGNDDDVVEFAKRDKVRYVEEFLSFSYAKLKYYDRYVNYSLETGEDEETTVLYVNLGMDKEDYTDPIIIKEYDNKVLVNKHRMLSKDYVPENLVKVSEEYASDKTQEGSREAVNAFIKMAKDAKKENLGIIINSSYRSYEEQEELCTTYANLYGQSYVDKYVAKAGFSEHQTGLAFDVGSTTSNVFANSKEYIWMQENAYKYGFIQKFPKGYENITGFRYESWHYRYVGKEIATYIHDHKMTYDEYYITFLDKN